jgi:AcrR family transcriptional regulator
MQLRKGLDGEAGVVKQSPDTREMIIDEAERLFAQYGYHGVSLRMVMKNAQVQLAAVSYYFGVKEKLHRAVIERRAEQLNAQRFAALERAVASAPAGIPSEEALIDVVVGPLLERSLNGGEGWQNYCRLIAQTATSPEWKDLISELFDPFAQAILEKLQQRFPDASRTKVFAAYYMIVAAMTFVFSQPGRLDRLSKGKFPATALADIYDSMRPFLAAGVRGLMAEPAPPRGRRPSDPFRAQAKARP